MRELSLHILDITQNSIAAGAQLVELTIIEDKSANELTIRISDDGCGMTDQEQKQVIDPFVTSRQSRDVGLGLPLLKKAAEQCAGNFKLDSTPAKGTTVIANFTYNHIDRAPLGDIEGTIITILTSNPELELVYCHQVEKAEFVFDTREVKEELGEISINQPRVLTWLQNYLTKNLAELRG